MSPRPKSSRSSSSSAALSRNPRLSKSVSEKDLSRWSSDLGASEKSGKIKEIIELLERQARAQILRASDARRVKMRMLTSAGHRVTVKGHCRTQVLSVTFGKGHENTEASFSSIT